MHQHSIPNGEWEGGGGGGERGRSHLHGDGNLVSALVGGTEEPSRGLPLLAQQRNGFWHRNILKTWVKDGATHKLLLPLTPVALSLQAQT